MQRHISLPLKPSQTPVSRSVSTGNYDDSQHPLFQTDAEGKIQASAFKEHARKMQGIGDIGIVPAQTVSEDQILYWQYYLRQGYQAGMGYLERNIDKRADPKTLLPGANSRCQRQAFPLSVPIASQSFPRLLRHRSFIGEILGLASRARIHRPQHTANPSPFRQFLLHRNHADPASFRPIRPSPPGFGRRNGKDQRAAGFNRHQHRRKGKRKRRNRRQKSHPLIPSLHGLQPMPAILSRPGTGYRPGCPSLLLLPDHRTQRRTSGYPEPVLVRLRYMPDRLSCQLPLDPFLRKHPGRQHRPKIAPLASNNQPHAIRHRRYASNTVRCPFQRIRLATGRPGRTQKKRPSLGKSSQKEHFIRKNQNYGKNVYLCLAQRFPTSGDWLSFPETGQAPAFACKTKGNYPQTTTLYN